MADKIKFLMGTISDITDKTSAHYPPVIGGRVYFSIDSLTSTATATQGQIYFDVPTNDGRAKRVLMNDRVSFATNASTASYADTANIAVNDVNGSKIVEKYIRSITISNNKLTYEKGNGTSVDVNLPTDTNDKVKITSTSTAGAKIYLLGNTSTALGSTTSSSIIDYTTTYNKIYIDTDGKLHGTITNASTASYASTARVDIGGNQIDSTYIKTITLESGNKLRYTKGNGSFTDVSLIDEKLKVTATNVSTATKAYLVGFTATTLNTAGNTTTSTGVTFPNIYIGSNGVINGTITNASSASYASTAARDSSGKQINTNYITSVFQTLDANGIPLLKYKKGDNTETDIGSYAPLTNGIIDLQYIPKTAIERIETVDTTADMYALTTATIQIGDIVHVTGTGKMYYVVDETKLNQAAGYKEFQVGVAGAVAWSNVTGKPPVLTTASSASLSTSTTTATLNINWIAYENSQRNQSFVIPAAATNVAGLVTTGAQTFAGNKTFNGLTSLSTANISHQLNYSGIGQSGNSVYYLWLASTASKGVPLYSTALAYTASSNTLDVTAKRATYDAITTTATIAQRYVEYDRTSFDSSTNKISLYNGGGNYKDFNINNYYPSSATWAANANSVTLTIRNRSHTSSALVSSAVSATIPLATGSAAGIVSATTQTFGGDKTFNGKIIAGNKIAVNNSADSTWSGDNNASFFTQGGISVSHQLSAKQIRIDESSNSKAVTLKFDANKEVLSFVFS